MKVWSSVVRKLVGLGLTTIALALGSCADGRNPQTSAGSAPPDVSRGQTDSSALHQSEAQDALRTAIINSISSGLVGFTHQLRLGGTDVVSTQGVQQLNRGWSASTVTDDPSTPAADADLDMEARSIGTRTWMQMKAWPAAMNGCWLLLEPDDVPVGIYGLQAGEVGYVSVLAGTEATHFEDESESRIAVDIGLSTAQMLFVGGIIESIQLPDSGWSTTRVPGTVQISGGRVRSIEMSGADLVDAVEQSGGTVADEGRNALNIADARVTFSRVRTNASIAPPPSPELVVTETEAEQGCH